MSATSNHWVWYVCAARGLTKTASLDQGILTGGDFSVLFGWVHYHAVMASFGVRHWRGHRRALQHWGTALQTDIDTLTPICTIDEV